MGSIVGFLVILIVWLVIRLITRSSGAGIGPTQLSKLTNRGASLLTIAIVRGMLWHVFSVISIHLLPRRDVDHLPVYERMDAIIRK
jgi:hypothetical protein